MTVLLAVFFVFIVSGTALGFPDVPPGHPHYQGISWVADRGISIGYPNGMYGPNDFVTRAQMGTFLYRTAGVLVAAGATVNVPFIISMPTAVDRWFNNVNGQKPTFAKNGAGEYVLNFGFDVSERFVQVTAVPTGLIVMGAKPAVRWATATVVGSEVRVWTYYWDGTEPKLADSNIHVLLY